MKMADILTTTFNKADEDKDGVLNKAEIATWIFRRIKEHVTLALKENVFIFTAVDSNPRNGVVSWEEYCEYYLKNKGFREEFIHQQRSSLQGLPRKIKEDIMRDKAAWSEATRDDPLHLTLDEFLAFRHPEASHFNIVATVEHTLSRLDTDEDSMLSEDEFADPDTNEIHESLTREQFQILRKKEFREIVDKNGDGKAEKKELVQFFDPRNRHHAVKEAERLIFIADIDRNENLSLEEVLEHKLLFIHSKMVDVAKSFHDEF